MKKKVKQKYFQRYVPLILLVTLIFIPLVISKYSLSRNISSFPSETPDPRKEYSVTSGSNGWNTLTVPYFKYQISFPKDYDLNNGRGDIQKNRYPATIFDISKLNGDGSGSGINLEIFDRKYTSLKEEITKRVDYTTLRNVKEIKVNGQIGYSFVQTANQTPPPKVIIKYYVIDMGDNKYVQMQGSIGYENNPSISEKELDQIVNTFKVLE